jgi:hypothetical protein
MKRRHFITLAGTAAIGTLAISSYPFLATQRSQWQPDGAGSLARIGILTPDFDPIPESEVWAMAPLGVSIHTSRVTWNRDDPRACCGVLCKAAQPASFCGDADIQAT